MQDDISGWNDWFAAFSNIPELSHAAELHGMVMGVICVAEAPSPQVWQELLMQLGFEPLSDEQLQLLSDEAEDAAAALADDALDYAPLLPDDDHRLAERVEALAAWCGGLVLGFGLAGGQLRTDEEELLRDVQEIAGMTFEPEDDDEEGEEGYADLVEFVRLIPVSLATGRKKKLLVVEINQDGDHQQQQAQSVVEMFQPDRPS